ncbi:GNAT family N-acetyltransferase [Cupriavidus sp. PET2-C1]
MTTSSVEIRLLTAADAAIFKAIRLLAIENAPTAIWPTRVEEEARSVSEVAGRIQSTPTQAVFGAFACDTLVGIAGVRRESLSQVSHKATIWGVFVAPNQRGKGVARDLLNTAMAHASKNWDSAQCNLCVNTENTAAKQLYESLGFAAFGIEPRAMKVDGRFYDEQHMVLKLR